MADEPKDNIATCAFHTRLVLLIYEKNLTCKQVAHEVGVSLDAVYHWTCGRRWPDSSDKVAKLAKALDVSCDLLITGKERPRKPRRTNDESGEQARPGEADSLPEP